MFDLDDKLVRVVFIIFAAVLVIEAACVALLVIDKVFG
jgi:phage shock protein PspC (stress-responsive transcriptional regulator)